jgi:hypothetical protein
MRSFGLCHDNRRALIRMSADIHVKRNPAKERHADAFGFRARSAMSEYLVLLTTIGANKIAHILDDAENWHLDASEHVQTLSGIDQRKILGSGHDYRTGKRHLLCHGQLCVTCSGRHIHDKNIELAPLHFPKHLGQR